MSTVLWRARFAIEIWPMPLASPLPVVPIPLQPPDDDEPLDLQAALREIYDEAVYDLSLNYNESPPPPGFSEEESDWITTRLEAGL